MTGCWKDDDDDEDDDAARGVHALKRILDKRALTLAASSSASLPRRRGTADGEGVLRGEVPVNGDEAVEVDMMDDDSFVVLKH